MKKILITSKDFEGEVMLLYSPDAYLMTLDFRNATLTPHQLTYIKTCTPVEYAPTLADDFGKAPLTFTDTKYSISFDTFWDVYNHKINRARCIKLWERLNEADKLAAYVGIKAYFSFLAREKWRNKVDPETYLTKKMWQNEWNKL